MINGPNRNPATWCQVVNPFWWLSDTERDTTWPRIKVLNYLPGSRWLCWFTRNPFCNLFSVVIGISHRTRCVYVSKGDGWTYVDGWNRGYIQALESNLRLPFISYRGKYIECVLGWKTSGAFDAALRAANAHQPNYR